MDINVGGIRDRGLDRYVWLVAETLGLTGDAYYIEAQPPVNAYLALTARLPTFPGRDTALIWDERHGWAGAIESISGDSLVVLTYLGHDILPTPRVVGDFARDLVAGHNPGQSTPPGFRTVETDDDLPQRLAAYAPAPILSDNWNQT